MTWIFLNKKDEDNYIDRFARGCGCEPTSLESWNYEDSTDLLVIRGIMKHKIIKQCWEDQRPFLYFDSGYFGNKHNPLNPRGVKIWNRVVLNDLQHNEIIPRPADRWQRLGLTLHSRRKQGSKIIIAAPDEKPCVFYGIDLNTWINDTVNEIKKYTDREIVIRERSKSRKNRNQDTLEKALTDAYALVTYNSIAATEAIIAGVPAFVLAPCNAAKPVANTDLSNIEDPWWPDADLRYAWVKHLAYGQFHYKELENGRAMKILKDTYNV